MKPFNHNQPRIVLKPDWNRNLLENIEKLDRIAKILQINNRILSDQFKKINKNISILK